MTAEQLKVTQVISTIGRPHPQRTILKGLGLRGIGSEVVVANTPSFRGMVKKVLHLVTVEEIAKGVPRPAGAKGAAPKGEKS